MKFRQHARMLMEMLKNLRPEWDIVTIPGYVEEAINWFEKHKHPDIIFLDIHLIDGNAFDFLSITVNTGRSYSGFG